jgi:hypothetical protein
MSSTSGYKRVCEDFFAALSAHNFTEAVSFVDPNCELVYNGEIATRTRDDLRELFEKEYSNPNSSFRIVKYLPNDHDNCIRLLADENGQQNDETYTFSKEGKIIRIAVNVLPNQ